MNMRQRTVTHTRDGWHMVAVVVPHGPARLGSTSMPTLKPHATMIPGARNTMESAVGRPDSAALSRPYFRLWAGMRSTATSAAWLIPRYEHPRPPAALRKAAGAVLSPSIRSLAP